MYQDDNIITVERQDSLINITKGNKNEYDIRAIRTNNIIKEIGTR